MPGNGGQVDNTYSSTYSEDNAEWQQYSLGAAAPEGAASVQAFVRLYDVKIDGEWSGSATAYVDGWSLEETDAPTE